MYENLTRELQLLKQFGASVPPPRAPGTREDAQDPELTALLEYKRHKHDFEELFLFPSTQT